MNAKTAETKKNRWSLKRFRREERGTTSIEFVLWFPFFIALQGMIADSSMAFMNLNRMYDVARDTARRASLGEMTASQAASHINSTLPGFIAPTVTVDDTDPTDLSIQIAAPISNLVFFGAFDAFSLGNVQINYTVRKEV